MKIKAGLLTTFGLAVGACLFAAPAPAAGEELRGTVTLSGAWALYPMAVRWAEEFRKLHPGVRVDIAAGGAGKGMADCLARVVDLGMVSREVYPAEVEKGAWWVSVTRDAVVPTANAGNPVAGELFGRGVVRDAFVDIWLSGRIKDWGQVVKGKEVHPISVYTRSDACGAAETWARYLGGKQEDLQGVGVYGDPGLAEAVRKDIWGIGFNNINYVYDASTEMPVPGLRVIPLDLNGDGRLDADERFYDGRDELVAAIASGKYPSPPARDLHFVSQGRPRKEAVRAFIKWVLSEGQKYVPESGYINLPEARLGEQMKKLGE